MPELRQDPTTKEWVVIATERARRPYQFGRAVPEQNENGDRSACPLCEGNESLTPAEVFAVRGGDPNGPGWRVRVIPNKFSAFVPNPLIRRNHDPVFHAREAYGHHEVIVETPDHEKTLASLSEDDILAVLDTYKARYEELRREPRTKLILIFRNHGKSAGTSLPHPHSQLVATPIIPLHIRQKYEVAIRHYDETGHCLYCDVLDAERRAAQRVVFESDALTVFHPFASQVPFETWIVPRRHNPSFGNINGREMKELASALKRVLGGLHKGLNNPDYNLIIHTAPVEDEHKPYFLWHVEIRPRLATAAGFEIGTGIYINTAIPEETAPFFRNLLLEARTAVR
jgi:UDPglucose--hexose-1-phosphate uridylyltransferase